MTDLDELRRVILDSVPPLRPPADRIEAVGRRVRGQRARLAVTGAAVGVVLVAAGAMVVTTLARGPAATGRLPVGAAPSASAPTRSPGGLAGENQATAQARLRAAVVTAVHAAAPGAAINGPITVQYLVSGPAGDKLYAYNIGLLLTVNGHQGSLVVELLLPQHDFRNTCAYRAAGPAERSCQDLTGPNGEKIMSIPVTGDGSSGGKHNHALVVGVARDDGSVVTVTCDNATKLGQPDASGYGFNTTGYTGDQPPLTIDQATALGLDQTLTLSP
jgi:hypothetical protein